jgi:hypothetical protein
LKERGKIMNNMKNITLALEKLQDSSDNCCSDYEPIIRDAYAELLEINKELKEKDEIIKSFRNAFNRIEQDFGMESGELDKYFNESEEE